MFQENHIETCILSRVKQITSPGWMHETSAWTWCTGKTQRDRVEREVGGGIRMGNTCISKADSCQCMKKKEKKNDWPKETRRKCTIKVIQTTAKKKKERKKKKRICLYYKRPRFDPWIRKIPWRRKWLPSSVFLLGEFLGQRSLSGYHPWVSKSQT